MHTLQHHHDDFINKIFGCLHVGLMAREFDELALDGQNYPTWALDVKISLAFRGIMATLTPPIERGNISRYLQVTCTIHHPKPPSS
jgi:hypothetical protein